MTARATWKGFLKIALVTIPIKVYPATESSASLSFNQLHNDCQTRVQQKRWCAKCEREVPTSEIVKGFEFEKGRYVILLEDELDAVQPPSTKVIDLVQFAEAAALPWMAIDRSYYLVPEGPEDGPAAAAYALLSEVLTDQIGIGKLAIYGREYLVAVGPLNGTLMLYTLHHAGELRPSPHVRFDAFTSGVAEVKLARQVIAALTGPLSLAEFTDDYQTDLRRLIDAKIAGSEIVEPVRRDAPPVLNLKEALAQSLQAVIKTSLAKATPAAKRKRAS
jgi:DNA end-binding protein Ku